MILRSYLPVELRQTSALITDYSAAVTDREQRCWLWMPFCMQLLHDETAAMVCRDISA